MSPTWARRRCPAPTAAAALERLVPGDMLGLKPGRQRYTLLTNEAGGILDDLMVANLGGDRLFLVVNASRKDDRLHPHRRQPAVRRAASCRTRIAPCWRCKGPPRQR